MIREDVFRISPHIIVSWEDEIQTATPKQLAEIADLCASQRRGWMASARGTKSRGSRPWVEVNMAWKYHRHLMMLRRAVRNTEAPAEPAQLALF